MCTRRHRSTTTATPPRLRLRFLVCDQRLRALLLLLLLLLLLRRRRRRRRLFSREKKPFIQKRRRGHRRVVSSSSSSFGGSVVAAASESRERRDEMMSSNVFLECLNESTKFVVSATAMLFLLFHPTVETCWCLLGSIVNSVNGKLLKRVLNHSRPNGAKKSTQVCRPRTRRV